ncbi:cysteine--1-D-myo-inosityl 2-amino-2-deoxy-alpha-D-glucopyranoside ligase [Flindersiella endophytica]
MESWRAPELSRLPGTGQIPVVHDVASGRRKSSWPGGDEAKLYVCGITPYDSTHIGHTATYIAFDLLHRAWLDAGLNVHYVQNVTDVDDPLLERAEQTGEDWKALADRQGGLFRADMAALFVVPPREYVAATEAIPLVIEAITRLGELGATYEIDGDVYFSVRSDPKFGQVSGLSRAAMETSFAENGGDPERPGKRDPLDSLLWLAHRPGEPAWESPFGPGRPGWHVECSAISRLHLGITVDVQGGGSDLAFPHHEMCTALTRVLAGGGDAVAAHSYVYQGMVALDGEKMSKSKGNLVFSSELRADGVDPSAIRLDVLSHHYRDDWEWTQAGLDRAIARLERWRAAAARPAGAEGTKVLAGVRDALADDLDAPAALGVIDAWAEATLAEPGPDSDAPGLVSDVARTLLGVELRQD